MECTEPRIVVAEPSHAPEIAAIYAPIVTNTAISFEETPPTSDEIAAKMAATLEQHPWLVALVENKVAGYAYASPHRLRDSYRWSVDVSVYVSEGHRGQRIGSKLYTALFSILRQQGYFNAYAGITQPNPASVALHESLGFTSVGYYHQVGFKRGEWHTVGWWQMALQPKLSTPSEPVPFPVIRQALDHGCGSF